MNKLKTYEAPSTRVAKVELRTNMLAGSIVKTGEENVEAKGHEIGGNYEFGSDNVGTTTDSKEFKVEWE